MGGEEARLLGVRAEARDDDEPHPVARRGGGHPVVGRGDIGPHGLADPLYRVRCAGTRRACVRLEGNVVVRYHGGSKRRIRDEPRERRPKIVVVRNAVEVEVDALKVVRREPPGLPQLAQ